MSNQEDTKVELNLRNFLGYGYFHIFTDDVTGEEYVVETTQSEFERLGDIDGKQFNPILPGYTWKYSTGKSVKVDTQNGFMSDKDYVIIDDMAYIKLKNSLLENFVVAKTDIVDNKIDKKNIIKK